MGILVRRLGWGDGEVSGSRWGGEGRGGEGRGLD